MITVSLTDEGRIPVCWEQPSSIQRFWSIGLWRGRSLYEKLCRKNP